MGKNLRNTKVDNDVTFNNDVNGEDMPNDNFDVEHIEQAEVNTEVAATEAKPVKKVSEVKEVTLQDGRKVEFVGRRKLIKTTTANEDGSFDLELIFLNGESRVINITPEHFLQYAMHGASQKLGDTFNAEDDLEDAIQATDEMILRLQRGEWLAERVKGEGKGGSMLVTALCEVYGLAKEKVQTFLLDKSISDKRALMASDEVKPVIDRIKAERAATAKPKVVEVAKTNALLDSIKALKQDETVTE